MKLTVQFRRTNDSQVHPDEYILDGNKCAKRESDLDLVRAICSSLLFVNATIHGAIE